MKIIIFIVLYFSIKRLWKILKYKIEKLEEYNGEFIFTSIPFLWKKEVYFNLGEIYGVLFKRMSINNNRFGNIVLRVFLEDGYSIIIRKKENCILFLKSCKENDEELYNKIIKSIPLGLDISHIIEKEIEEYKNKK